MEGFRDKISSTLSHLSSNETVQAVSELRDLMTKKKEKVYDKFTAKQKLIVELLRALCLLKNGQYGEADACFLGLLAGYKEFDAELEPYSKIFITTAVHLRTARLSFRPNQTSKNILRALLQEVSGCGEGVGGLPAPIDSRQRLPAGAAAIPA
jgi:hypothetical protein